MQFNKIKYIIQINCFYILIICKKCVILQREVKQNFINKNISLLPLRKRQKANVYILIKVFAS